MNVVMTGLKVMERELARLGADEHSSILDILSDVKLSCDAAVDLLDDLLAYEKLDAGIMTLERSRMTLDAFVHKALCPFYIQVTFSLQLCVVLFL